MRGQALPSVGGASTASSRVREGWLLPERGSTSTSAGGCRVCVLGCTHPCVPISVLRIPHILVLCHWTGRSRPTLLSLGACALSSPNTCVITPALGSPPARLLPIVTHETLNNGVSRAFPEPPCPLQQPEWGRLSHGPPTPYALRTSCASGSSRERTPGDPRGCPRGNGCEREGRREPGPRQRGTNLHLTLTEQREARWRDRAADTGGRARASGRGSWRLRQRRTPAKDLPRQPLGGVRANRVRLQGAAASGRPLSPSRSP